MAGVKIWISIMPDDRLMMMMRLCVISFRTLSKPRSENPIISIIGKRKIKSQSIKYVMELACQDVLIGKFNRPLTSQTFLTKAKSLRVALTTPSYSKQVFLIMTTQVLPTCWFTLIIECGSIGYFCEHLLQFCMHCSNLNFMMQFHLYYIFLSDMGHSPDHQGQWELVCVMMVRNTMLSLY